MLERVRDAVPVMANLPGDVGQQKENSEAKAEPWPPTRKQPPLPGDHQAGEHRQPEPDHRVFRLEANPEDEAEP